MNNDARQNPSVINLLADIGLPVLFMAGQYLFSRFITNPNLSLGGAIAGVLLLGFYLVGTRYTRGPARAWTMIGGAILSIGVVATLLIWAPFCARQLTVNYEVIRQASSPEMIFSSTQVLVDPDEPLMVRAYDVGQTEEIPISCVWHYLGDGYIENQMGCTILVRSGSDRAEDNLVVDMQQQGCPWRTTTGLYLSPRN